MPILGNDIFQGTLIMIYSTINKYNMINYKKFSQYNKWM